MNIPKINWIPFDRNNPPADLSYDVDYLIVLRERETHGDKDWRYSIDIARPYGDYIDNFWDTDTDWCEGQPIEVVAYAELPYWKRESELVEV
jgi:hypothetical protein